MSAPSRVLVLPHSGRIVNNLGLDDDHTIRTPTTDEILRLTDPNYGDKPEWLRDYQQKNLPNIMRGVTRIQKAETLRLPYMFGMLWLKKLVGEEVFDYGLVSCRVVTTAGVNALVDAFQGTFTLTNFRYHGIGTGAVAESAADTALGAELSTAYSPDSTRGSGTLTEGAAANVFRTVGTNVVDASVTITEHGLFSAQTAGTGTLLDRSVFAGVALVSGNSLQSTYDFTVAAGS
jgi:hypothetical protein